MILNKEMDSKSLSNFLEGIQALEFKISPDSTILSNPCFMVFPWNETNHHNIWHKLWKISVYSGPEDRYVNGDARVWKVGVGQGGGKKMETMQQTVYMLLNCGLETVQTLGPENVSPSIACPLWLVQSPLLRQTLNILEMYFRVFISTAILHLYW